MGVFRETARGSFRDRDPRVDELKQQLLKHEFNSFQTDRTSLQSDIANIGRDWRDVLNNWEKSHG